MPLIWNSSLGLRLRNRLFVSPRAIRNFGERNTTGGRAGSWRLGSLRELRYAEYDGQLRTLSLHRDGKVVWQGPPEELTDPKSSFFRKLIYL